MSHARRTRTIFFVVVLALSALMAVPATGLAKKHHRHRHHHKIHVRVGIGDQSVSMFSQPAFQALHLRKARYIVPWDLYRPSNASKLAEADAWVEAARREHVRPLIHISTNEYTEDAHLPSRHAYRVYVGKIVRHFMRLGVREFGVWNEANHAKQPTSDHPGRAAGFFKDMYRMCHKRHRRHCTVVALDVLDQRGSAGYIRRFYRHLSRRWRHRARVVGIHNYSDTNRPDHHGSGTKVIIRHVRHYNRHTKFWLTETGGIVNFGGAWPCDEHRAAKSVTYMFHLAKKFRRHVKRLYAYNWTGNGCQGFDAGLTDADGTPREGYNSFRKQLPHFKR